MPKIHAYMSGMLLLLIGLISGAYLPGDKVCYVIPATVLVWTYSTMWGGLVEAVEDVRTEKKA